MIAVALKGLAGRKVRALLTALAVVIGISMVSGTYILTDTMQKSFDGLFAATYDKTDAIISGKEIVKDSTSGSSAKVPAGLLAQVQDLPEVGEAGGVVAPDEANIADIIGKDGKKVARESVGASYDAAHPQFTPLKLKSGDWPKGSGQVVIDAGTATKQHYKVGDAIKVSTLGKQASYELSGIVKYGDVDSLGFASIAAWDLKTAQTLLHREGNYYDSISISAAKGTSSKELVRAVQPLVPGALQVKDSAKQAKDDAEELNSSMSIMKYFLLGFGAIALLVGAFVIFNTLSITVAQRTREFATLRTLGASRKQVMRSVVAEGLVIGLLASAIGLVVGIALAKGLVAMFAAMGVELPDGATIIAPRTIILSIVVGTVTTLLASILPAKRATRVPPIAAVREGSTLPPSRYAAHTPKAGVIIAGASVAAVLIALFAGGLSGAGVGVLLGGGVLGLFLGMALLAPRLVTPLARVVGWPARRTGVAGELAGANAVRNPGRTASTAAALMIGLTLVTLVAVLASSLTTAGTAAVKKEIHADYVIDGKDGQPFRAADGDRLEQVSGVTSASHVRSDTAIVDGKERTVDGIDPATIAHFYKFRWVKGSEHALGQLGTDGAIVEKGYAKKQHLAIGDTVKVTMPSGAKRTLVVRGIHHARTDLLADVSMTQKAFDQASRQPKNSLTFLDGGSRAAVKAQVAGFGDATFHTGSGYAADKAKEMQKLLSMLYVLLGFSVIVSLFGMVNTLVLSVFERTREIGMLRTIGMTRRQARQMIRHESIITALIGAALGLGVGTALAWIVMAKWHLPLALPVNTLFGFTLIAVLAGVGAAVMPARRASRLNVLEALQYE